MTYLFIGKRVLQVTEKQNKMFYVIYEMRVEDVLRKYPNQSFTIEDEFPSDERYCESSQIPIRHYYVDNKEVSATEYETTKGLAEMERVAKMRDLENLSEEILSEMGLLQGLTIEKTDVIKEQENKVNL